MTPKTPNQTLFLMFVSVAVFFIASGSARAQQRRDFIMVSLGDSYASGEGAPNAAAASGHGPAWNDVVCHRSENAPAILAFNKLKSNHPGISFASESTGHLVHFACSGAGVIDGILGPQGDGSGGVKVPKPQIQMVTDWMASHYPNAKKIDALIIDIGGNDANFKKILERCLLPKLGAGTLDALDCSKWVDRLFSAGMVELTKPGGSYDRLVDQIVNQAPSVAHVFFTEYPDPAHDASGRFCDSQPFPDFGGLTANESRWASETVVASLNHAIENLVARANRRSSKTAWHMIRGITSQFVTHGVCSDSNYVRGRPQNRFVNTLGDSLLVQSDSRCDVAGALSKFMDAPARILASDPNASLDSILEKSLVGGCDYNGAVHPNARGYLAYRDPIVASISPLLDPPATPGTFKREFMNDSNINIRWTDTAINEDVYEIRYHTSRNNNWNNISLDEGSTGWTLNTMTPGETYTFGLRACSYVIGISPSCSDWASLTVVHEPPSAPTNARVEIFGPAGPRRSKILRWDDNSSNEDGYEVQFFDGTTWNSAVRANGNITRLNVELFAGNAYRVRACISQLCSDWSNIARE